MPEEEQSASPSTEPQRERVEQGPYQTVLLDEIAERLCSLEEMAKKEVPEGKTFQHKFTLTNQEKVINVLEGWAPHKLCFGVKIINDGSSDGLYGINNLEATTDILNGEIHNVDFSRAKVQIVRVKTLGTATFRVILAY